MSVTKRTEPKRTKLIKQVVTVLKDLGLAYTIHPDCIYLTDLNTYLYVKYQEVPGSVTGKLALYELRVRDTGVPAIIIHNPGFLEFIPMETFSRLKHLTFVTIEQLYQELDARVI